MAGIVDVDTIDIVAQDASGQFMMVMVETRPWEADRDQSAQLRAKINTYAGYILDGGLAREYPETAGQPVNIQLECSQAPNGEIAVIIEHAAAKLVQLGIGFRINVRG